MSFNTEKNVPVVNFIADSTKRATGLYGPEALLEALTEIVKMFDPESTHSDNETPGGISKDNLSKVFNAFLDDLVSALETECYNREIKDSEVLSTLNEKIKNEEDVRAENDGLLHEQINNLYEDMKASISEHASILTNHNNQITANESAISDETAERIKAYQDLSVNINIILKNYSTKEETETALTYYVKKEDGKVLSSNDFTNDNKENLNKNTQARHTHTYDDLPTPNSNNLLTSGAVYNVINSLSPFVINGTADYVGGELSSTTFDKSYQEIKEVIDSGVSPIVNVDIKYNGITRQSIILNFKGYMGSSIIFSSVTMNADIDVLFGKSGNASFSFKILKEYNEKATTWDDNYYDDEVLYLTPKAMVDFFNSKTPEFKGYNSLSYFFASNYNNDLFGAVETSGALFADYIFKQNSMTEITVDLSNCYSMVGGFLNSEAETVIFENGTPKLTKAQNLFRGCKNLKNVTGLILTSVDSCKYMFYGCESLTEMSELIISGDCSYMFYGCKALTSVNLDCTNLTNVTGIFTGCTSLLNITLKGNQNFTTLFNSLEAVENGTIKVDNASQISDEVKKIATDKGWTIE